jgi:hypothetical protein
MDVEAYDHVIRRLQKVLDVVRLGKEQYSVPVVGAAKSVNRYRSALGAVKGGTAPRSKGRVWQLWVETATTGVAEKTEWDLSYLDVDFARSVAPLQGQLHALLTALGPDGQVVAMDLSPLEPARIQYYSEHWYKWVSAPVPPAGERPDQLFLSPFGLQLSQLKANQALDYVVETTLQRTLRVKGVPPERVSAVYCTLVYIN